MSEDQKFTAILFGIIFAFMSVVAIALAAVQIYEQPPAATQEATTESTSGDAEYE